MRPSLACACLAAAFGDALVLPQTTLNCSSFVKALDLRSYSASLLNTTYYPIGGLSNSGVLNNVSFCEVYASISYGTGNDSLVFAIWLPEVVQYEGRFMAVGSGGMAGMIDYANMMTQLNSGMGFAVAGGDAGHLASNNNNGGGAPGVHPIPPR